MYEKHTPRLILWGICSTLVLTWAVAAAKAQEMDGHPIHYRVQGPNQRLEMIVNTSRILTLEHKVPRMLVNNPDIVRATPLSPNQVQLSALKPGVTQLNLWDENEQVYAVDVIVSGDARELANLLKAEFPDAALTVRPLASSVIISGYVPSASMVGQIVRVAEDYYPSVINNMRVAGVQTVLLHTKVMEVSRTKLRKLGVDWAWFNGNDGVVQGVSGLIQQYTLSPNSVTTGFNETLAFGIVNQSSEFLGFLEALRQHNLVKLLAEPTLVTTSGRPASFNSGGEFPIIVPQSLGTVSIEYRQFGTRVDFVPLVLGNGNLRLEVRPQVSEIDPTRSVVIQNVSVPGLRTRWVDTAVEMRAGQTLALAGLIQTRVEAENRGIPVLADLPWVGAAFRRVEERNNEVELVILVTPEIVDAMDPHEVPPCGPGQFTAEPDDHDLYIRGFVEVPHCGPNCAGCPDCQTPPAHPLEEVPSPAAIPHAVQGGGPVPTPAAAAPVDAQAWRLPPAREMAFRLPPIEGPSGPQPPRDSSRPAVYQAFRPQPYARPGAATRPPARLGPTGYDNQLQ